jgi:hypothetical protein
MASDSKDKGKDKDKEKKPKPKPDEKAKGGKPAGDKPAKDKPPKDKSSKADEAAAAPETPKPAPPPRPPADPRLKVVKKFRGRFLPKGPLRDRLNALMTRWNSGDDHGGVTHDELKSLHRDWVASRERKRKPTAV